MSFHLMIFESHYGSAVYMVGRTRNSLSNNGRGTKYSTQRHVENLVLNDGEGKEGTVSLNVATTASI